MLIELQLPEILRAHRQVHWNPYGQRSMRLGQRAEVWFFVLLALHLLLMSLAIIESSMVLGAFRLVSDASPSGDVEAAHRSPKVRG